jgi:hypothetical protein
MSPRFIALAPWLGLLFPRVAFAQAAAPPQAPGEGAAQTTEVAPERQQAPEATEVAPEREQAPARAPAPAPDEKSAPGESDSVFAEVEQALSNPAAATPSAKPKVGPTGSPAAQSLNPDLSLVLDFAAAAFSKKYNLQTGEHDPHETGPNLQQLELNLRSVVDPFFRFDASLVFATDGVEVEEAYGTTLELPAGLQARFGRILTRFGRLNPTHPHAWDFVDQPFALGRVFGSEGSGGLGAELSWLLPLPWYVELVGSATSATGATTARSFNGERAPGVESPADLLYITALKQFFDLSDDWSLLWGLSGAFGPNSTRKGNRTEVVGTDLYVKYRPITRASYTSVSWHTEVLHRRRQVPGGLELDVNGFSQLALRFARRWATAARYEYGSVVFDTHGVIQSSDLDPEWTKPRQRVALNLTHYPSEYSRLRLQGSRDMPGYTDPVWAVFLAAELVVGAHGAHPF